jgi:AcrR family transcriptional regulator
MTTEEKISKAYIEFELLNGRAPFSAFELAKKIKIEEADFYAHFASIEKVREGILTSLLQKTFAIMDSDENYESFSAREKLLSLYFTLFEQFQTQRSYLLALYADLKKAPHAMRDWKPFLKIMEERVEEILSEGKITDEIKDRPLIGNHFPKGFHFVFTYLFRVWLNDDSAEFANTDAAIEKTVNLSVDLLGTSPLDSLLDFGKFALKTKVF